MEKVETQSKTVELNDNVYAEGQPQPQMEGQQPIDPDAPLTQDQALSILVQAVKLAQKTGAFTLDDAEIINKAIRTFVKKD